MISNAMITGTTMKEFKRFIKTNEDLDFYQIDLLSIDNNEDLLERIKKSKSKKENIIELLRAFQRLLRIMDPKNKNNNEIAIILIENNIHSALQIASFPPAQFIAKWQTIIPESLGTGADAQLLYNRAVIRKCRISVEYVKQLQNNEPHVLAAKI